VVASASPPELGPTDGAPRLVRLKRRPEFLAASRGARSAAGAFQLQTCRRPGDAGVAGIGFTVTRKIGGAVQRNRARRRLREAVRSLPGGAFAPGWNYVVVARAAALTCPFAQLRTDLLHSLERLRRVRG
jgi:ribonuclease P protein component